MITEQGYQIAWLVWLPEVYMKSKLADQLAAIATFAERYLPEVVYEEGLTFKLAPGTTLEERRERVWNDWWLAFLFFLDRAYYQGRRDELSKRFEYAAIEALKRVFGEGVDSFCKAEKLTALMRQGGLDWKNPQGELWDVLTQKYSTPFGKSGTGKRRDREMVLDALKWAASEIEDHNLVRHSLHRVNEGRVAEIYERLRCLRGVGPKTAALFLRDVVLIWGTENSLQSTADYVYVFPIDTWVRQVLKELDEQSFHGSDEELAEQAIKACLENRVSPMKFNIGAWHIGAHSFKTLMEIIKESPTKYLEELPG